jgi:hypothetical protein
MLLILLSRGGCYKEELESQCADMLRQGVIRLSSLVFSAPVLLVKKHVGSWRFCVDCRAVNNKMNALATFHAPMNDTLWPFLRRFVLVFV